MIFIKSATHADFLRRKFGIVLDFEHFVSSVEVGILGIYFDLKGSSPVINKMTLRLLFNIADKTAAGDEQQKKQTRRGVKEQ